MTAMQPLATQFSTDHDAKAQAAKLRTSLQQAWIAHHRPAEASEDQILASPEELASLNGFDIPSADDATYFLRELDWDSRFTGMDVNAAAGESILHFYSLAEVAKFFRFGTTGLGFARGGGGSVSVAKVEEVIDWIRTKVNDHVLADTLERDLDPDSSYQDCVLVISRLLNMRVTQLVQIAQS